jgi:hypothetical protein
MRNDRLVQPYRILLAASGSEDISVRAKHYALGTGGQL